MSIVVVDSLSIARESFPEDTEVHRFRGIFGDNFKLLPLYFPCNIEKG